MCTFLTRTVRALGRDDPGTGEALSVDLVSVQLGAGSMAMKAQAAVDAAVALREISPLDPNAAARRRGGGGGRGGAGRSAAELLPAAAERLRLALRAPLPQRQAATRDPSSSFSSSLPPPSSPSLTIPPWFLIETKIDGYRLQLHKDETPGTGFGVRFFSPRSYIEHGGERGYEIMRPLAKRLVRPVRCVLDGELVVYHSGRKMIEPVSLGCFFVVDFFEIFDISEFLEFLKFSLLTFLLLLLSFAPNQQPKKTQNSSSATPSAPSSPPTRGTSRTRTGRFWASRGTASAAR